MTSLFPLLAAVGAAIGYGSGSVVQAIASHQATALRVFLRPAYIIGTVITLVAWSFSLIALRYLPLLTAQTILSFSLVVTVVLDRVVFHTRMRRIDVIAAATVTGSLVVLALGAGPQATAQTPPWFGAAMLALLLVIGTTTALTYRRGIPAIQGTLSGVSSAGLAMCVRAAHGAGDWLDFVMAPTAWLTICFAVLSSLTFARAVERGSVGSTRAIITSVQAALPGAVGILVLGDTLRPGWGWIMTITVVITLSAATVLALSPAIKAADAAASNPPGTDAAAQDV